MAAPVEEEAEAAPMERVDELAAAGAAALVATADDEELDAPTGAPGVIHETSDNCGGGSPGDGTHLLRAMIEARLPDACFGFIVDPETSAAAPAETGGGGRRANP